MARGELRGTHGSGRRGSGVTVMASPLALGVGCGPWDKRMRRRLKYTIRKLRTRNGCGKSLFILGCPQK